MNSDAIPLDQLTQALLQRLDLGEESDPRRAVLTDAVEQMLRAPTAQAHARAFLAEAASARVRFGSIEPKGLAEWSEGLVIVTLNERYVEGACPLTPPLPVVLCHELLGHGLWNARGHRQSAWQAIHHHELNEVYALLLDWTVELELEGRSLNPDARSYLADAQAYLAGAKLRMPYYAMTFSSEAMRRPVETIEARIGWMAAQQAERERDLANLRSWGPVMHAFVKRGRIPEDHLEDLRRDLADHDAAIRRDLRNIELGLAQLRSTLERMRAEPDRQSERYLIWAADCPAVQELTRETEAMEQRLRARLAALPQANDDPPAAEHDDDQITFDRLLQLYHQDRAENPRYWNGA